VDRNDEFYLKQLLPLSEEIRGRYLNQATFVDAFLSDILANYFCSDPLRRVLFFSEVLNSGEFTFSAKVNLLKNVLKLRFPATLEKQPTLQKKLTELMEHRNTIAHSHLDTSFETIGKREPNQITLITYKKGETKKIVITLVDHHRRLAETSEVLQMLRDVKKDMTGDPVLGAPE
jgi:hypothetical protein